MAVVSVRPIFQLTTTTDLSRVAGKTRLVAWRVDSRQVTFLAFSVFAVTC